MTDQWHVIVREESSNLVENPSAEKNITDWWSNVDAGAGAVFERATATTYYGIGSFKLTAGNANCYFAGTAISVDDGETIYAQCVSRSSGATKNDLLLRDTTNGADRATTAGTSANTWEKLSASWTNSTGLAANIVLRMRNTAANGTAIVYFDGVQAEIDTSAETTYIDGDQPGCEWNGEAHNSTSTRSALSYDGGVDNEFGTDLSFWVDAELGVAAPPISNTFQPYAMTKGDFYNGSRIQGRPFTLNGLLKGTSKTNLHTLMNTMQTKFAVHTGELVRLEYTGGTNTKYIKARYEAGLQGDYRASNPVNQVIPLRFYAPDPNFYQVNDTNVVLDANDTATLYYLAGRKRSSGQWSNLGLSAVPTAGGTIYAVLAASDGSIYFGGDFDGIDNNSPVGGDYIIRYDPVVGDFNLLVGASDLNGAVWAMTEGPDGTIYIAGAFTAVNGVGTADYIVAYNPTADTWSSLGDPDSGGAAIDRIQALAWDSSGNLYAGGFFTDIEGVGAADHIAKWDGTSWSAVGSGGTGRVQAIAIDSNDNIYIGGNFLNWASDANADNWAWWNGSAWAAVNDIVLNDVVYALTFDEKDNLYVGGSFTDADSNTNADYIFIWNGQQVSNLGSPPDSGVYKIKISPNDDIYVSGSFTKFGTSVVADRIGIWNGATWASTDINMPGAPVVYDIAFGSVDPIYNNNIDVYLGFSTTGSAQLAGDATVTNDGNADAWPTFKIKRSGGTSATLYKIRNETTGKTLYFNHGFADGDTLTIELSKDGSKVTSDFLGVRRKAILANSDDGTFVLIPGDNIITCFVDVAGAPTITANCLFKEVYGGYDD